MRERVIGVLDVITKIYKTSLISTELDQVDPRGLAVDPTTRSTLSKSIVNSVFENGIYTVR